MSIETFGKEWLRLFQGMLQPEVTEGSSENHSHLSCRQLRIRVRHLVVKTHNVCKGVYFEQIRHVNPNAKSRGTLTTPYLTHES